VLGSHFVVLENQHQDCYGCPSLPTFKELLMSELKRVSPREAQALLDNGYTYVDVRSEPEFDEVRPQGSINVPLLRQLGGGMAPNPEFMTVMEKTFPKSTKLVVGCRSGRRSEQAARMLIQQGFETVVDQRAGMVGTGDAFGAVQEKGWEAEGLAVERGPAAEQQSYAGVIAGKVSVPHA
jgi:rhodanese-related sulfurtransferase